MKLIRIGTPGQERPAALVEDGRDVNLSDAVDGFDEGFFRARMLNDLSATVQKRVEAEKTIPLNDERIGSPISRPYQIICVGLNYADHAEETAQEVLERGGRWLKGKSAESFNPTGPILATLDEISSVSSLGMWLEANGVRRQTRNSATMIFDPFFIVHYISQFLVLEPGDLINTGTPPGFGIGLTPPVRLAAGDEIALGIDGLGEQRQTVRHWSQRRVQSLGGTEKPAPRK